MSSSSGRLLEAEAREERRRDGLAMLRQHFDEEFEFPETDSQRVHFEFENVLLEVS